MSCDVLQAWEIEDDSSGGLLSSEDLEVVDLVGLDEGEDGLEEFHWDLARHLGHFEDILKAHGSLGRLFLHQFLKLLLHVVSAFELEKTLDLLDHKERSEEGDCLSVFLKVITEKSEDGFS